MFQEYEKDFDEYLEKVKGSGSNGGDEYLQEARELLGQMRLEMRTMTDKVSATAAFQTCEKNLRDLETARDAESLMGGMGTERSGAEDKRNDMKNTVTRMEASKEKISYMKELIDDIEEDGNEIQNHLATNRETIQSVDSKVRVTNAKVGESDKLMTRMGKWWRRW